MPHMVHDHLTQLLHGGRTNALEGSGDHPRGFEAKNGDDHQAPLILLRDGPVGRDSDPCALRNQIGDQPRGIRVRFKMSVEFSSYP